jgi:inner membrane protein
VPSPLGHALAAFAAGWAGSPAACRELPPDQTGGVKGLARRFRWPLSFAAVGLVADLDLLFGIHSRYTHSLGGAAAAFAAAWLVLRGRFDRPAAAAFALALSYASHVVLDWLASDTAPPLGVMALWPFSRDFYLSPFPVFMGISRKYWLPLAWSQNAVSVAWELVLLAPVAVLAWRLRPPRRR